MTIGYTGAWTAKAGLLVRDTVSRSKPVPQSVKVRQMLDLVGDNPVELDTVKMDKMKLRKQMKGFDPTNVSVKSMGSLSVFLKERGLISDVTAVTLSNAGDKFDRFGIKDPDAKFNALEYFATQLENIQNNNLKGNKYANYLVPEFKKAIYVLQNLETYGKSNGPMVRPGSILSDEA
ncbi:hypothetical protein D3C87_1190690 [compost metagenome]|jgi:hypothetical protein|uniref:Uncharacterized protein n=1 Tax=Pseudomonas fluorescens TaxID=294 RepID=A0A8H2NP49_PSEFL|nr:hypothetical protein [Pseudomonas fluorescens]CAG8866368.1 hypothetical protein PS861_01385 [Pseudomonas fluorescens]VVO60865.1 hypothetical protein PS900_00789 [Pseudomonas fluorescens]VVP75713.1 hypothetical protein PS934_00209 [Pseudomonas fluorescens]